MTPAKLRLAMAAMGKPETNVGDLCRELGVTGPRSIDTSRLPASPCNARRLLKVGDPAGRLKFG